MVKLGFLGTGWIGLNRMEAMLGTGEALAAAICDPSDEMVDKARALAPDALVAASLGDMLKLDLDGVVIATPSALHAEQCVAAFEAGKSVFCQKPLGRNSGEVTEVLDAARRADRLLGVDLSYRHTAAMRSIRQHMTELGRPFAADLTFHNAYGPGSGWFWDRSLSGGGCLIDLGVHLVDLALWLFDFPDVVRASATLLRDGHPVCSGDVEDYAIGEFELSHGPVVRIACSWNLNAGADAVIEASIYGTEGGARMRNDKGSFFDFSADLLKGRKTERLSSPPDNWSGAAAGEFVRGLARGSRFSGTTEGLLETALVLDRLYATAVATSR